MKFEEIAWFIWGGIPIDREWAITTLVYQQYLEKCKN